jgi:hypothetical protein
MACRQLCMVGSLDPEKAKGKIVVYLRGINARVAKGEAVWQAGGVGMVLANDKSTGQRDHRRRARPPGHAHQVQRWPDPIRLPQVHQDSPSMCVDLRVKNVV